MKLHRFEAEQRVGVPVETAWRFFSDARNLPHITPPWLGFEVVSPLPARVHPGLIICYRVRPIFRVPLDWVTEITHVREGELFVDEQRSGPYRFWHHQHHFRAVGSETEIRDIVHYALPAGPLTVWAEPWLVRPRLQAIFQFRRAAINRLLSA